VDAARSEGEQVAFLVKIATNLALDDIRKEKRGQVDMPPDTPASEAGRRSQLKQDVGRALEALAPRERAMLWMAHVDGYSHAEIAAVVSVGAASVKVLLHRARRKLAGVLENMGMGPEALR
jgi:RNA polymerase sigma-70 factor (ECF subfamily)